MIRTIDYNQYEFVLRTEDRTIEVYRGGWREKILYELPEGFSWDNIENLFQKENHKKEVSELASKLSECL